MKAANHIYLAACLLLAFLPLAPADTPTNWLLVASPSRHLPPNIVSQLPSQFHPSSGRMLISLPTPYGRFFIDRDRYLNLVKLPASPQEPNAANTAPFSVGTETTGLPSGFQTLLHEGETLFYSQGNFFAYHEENGFLVVEPPIGAHLNQLPPEAQPFGNTIHIPGAALAPVNRFGRIAYEIRRLEN